MGAGGLRFGPLPCTRKVVGSSPSSTFPNFSCRGICCVDLCCFKVIATLWVGKLLLSHLCKVPFSSLRSKETENCCCSYVFPSTVLHVYAMVHSSLQTMRKITHLFRVTIPYIFDCLSLRVIACNSGTQMRVCDSSATRIFFLKK